MYKGKLGIYVHIPFCVRKCNYCDFLSFGEKECQGMNAAGKLYERYVRALCEEIEAYRELVKEYEVGTIYFGGGTPSILDEYLIIKILDKLRDTFSVSESAEITIECNPGTTSLEKFKAYRGAGINRLSLGLQSANNRYLKMLGRVHTYEEFLIQYEEAVAAGFSNINVDIISALPGQSLHECEEDVRRVVELKPAHISSYGLIVEEGTPLFNDKELLKNLPTDEASVEMYERTVELLEQCGYRHYEISNYCREGMESEHNSSYWTGRPYLGLGLGASSYFDNQRFHNVTKIEEYFELLEVEQGGTEKNISALREESYIIEQDMEEFANIKPHCLWREVEQLTEKDRMEEFMFLGLRMMKGVSFSEFEERFQRPLKQVYKEAIEKHKGAGLLREYEEGGNSYLALTKKGIMVSNQVFVDFIIE